MKAILGVDTKGSFVGALRLLARLDFPGLHVDALHVLEAIKHVAPFPTAHHYSRVFKHEQTEGEQLLESAVNDMRRLGIDAAPILLHGTTPAKLIESAETAGADLIVVGSQRMGKWGSLFFGSVTRALAIESPKSFLVGKSEGPTEGRIHAVFAVDHSPYCDRCVERFFEMAPAGVGKVTLLTAHWTDISMLDMALKDSHLDANDLYDWIENNIRSRSEGIAQRLKERGIEADIRISHEEPREAIEGAMKTTGADLLIMGARGHGLKERLVLGSVAMHEVVVSPHSVLVIRA